MGVQLKLNDLTLPEINHKREELEVSIKRFLQQAILDFSISTGVVVNDIYITINHYDADTAMEKRLPLVLVKDVDVQLDYKRNM